MQKQTTLTISREDLFKLLAEKGYDIPSHATMRDGDQDWACDVSFPIVVTWREVPDSLKGDAQALVTAHKWIEAIKLVRSATGWGLKQSKDWVNENCPRPPVDQYGYRRI